MGAGEELGNSRRKDAEEDDDLHWISAQQKQKGWHSRTEEESKVVV